MQFKKGAEVISSDGEKIGTLDRVVMDPRTKEVTHLVVRSGFLLTEDKLIPIDRVGPMTDDRISVMASKESLDDFQKYEDIHYAPMDRDVESPEYADVFYWYPPVMGAMGSNIAGTILPFPQTHYIQTTETNLPEGTIALREGAKVLTSDGEHVGNIERLITDENNNLVTHLVISNGLFFKERKLIPAHWLASAAEDEVQLAIEFKFLDRLPDFHLES